MSKKQKVRRHFWLTAGDLVENAVTHNVVLAQAMGLCPIIAAGISLKNGVALTVCTAVVMLPLSLIISLVGSRLPKWLRPVLYVLLASLLLVATAFTMEKFISPELYARLYIFIPLIAVNMLHFRSIGSAATVKPIETVIDALGSTIGFGTIICLISALREIAISGTIWDQPLGMTVHLPEAAAPFTAFILLGFMSALLQWTQHRISAYFHAKEESHR